jgi:hypothetical protein
MANEADKVNEAHNAKADEATEAIVTNDSNKIVVANKANVIKANVVDRANLANKAYEASLADANKLLANGDIAAVVKYLSKLPVVVMYLSKLLTLLPFSPTKSSAFFSKDKGYFGICVEVRNNKLLVVKCINQLECLESCWSKLCSLRNELRN